MNNIQSQIFDIIQSLRLDRTALSEHTSLRTDLRVDSLSLTELIIACEDQFEIEIDMDDPMILKIDTVHDLCNAIEQLVNSD